MYIERCASKFAGITPDAANENPGKRFYHHKQVCNERAYINGRICKQFVAHNGTRQRIPASRYKAYTTK